MLVERLPDRYTATARLLLQSSDLTGTVSPPMRQSNEAARAQIIEQRLLTDQVLRDIAVSQNQASDDPSKSIAGFRSRVDVQTRSGRDRATIIQITFTDPDPSVARDVTNALADKMVDDNFALQNASSAQRLRFFRNEVATAQTQLQEKTQELAQFRSDNAATLPDVMNRLLDRQARLEDQLLYTPRTTARTSETSDERALAQLREEHNEASAVFSQSHPYLRMLQAKVEQANAATEQSQNLSRNTNERPSRDSLKAELDRIETLIRQVPATGLKLEALSRERTLAETRYTLARNLLSEAERAAQVNSHDQGDRLNLIEQAVQPILSSSKRRKLILLVGTALAIFVASMSIVILNRLDHTIRRADMLQTRLGITAFGVLPDLRQDTVRI